MPEKKVGQTVTQFVVDAQSDAGVRDEFVRFYVDFLCAMIRRGPIWAGRGLCLITSPQKEEIIEELNELMCRVCLDFLEKKATSDFIEKIRQSHRGQAERHYSVRTTLQYMLVNELRRNAPPGLIVNFEGKDIEIFLKDDAYISPDQEKIISKEERREMHRRLRIFLTRLAGKGNIGKFPTPYDCYCLYHGCFGTDRKKIVQTYVSDPEKQQAFLKEGDWDDADVGALLAERYRGKKQPMTNRRISCERKTINNRRREYQEYLAACIRHYMPAADTEEIRQILDKRDVDVDTLLDFCAAFIQRTGMTRDEAGKKMKDRTLEQAK